jgi:hypothetical protein
MTGAEDMALIKRRTQAVLVGTGMSLGMTMGLLLPNPAMAQALLAFVGSIGGMVLTEWAFTDPPTT